MKHLSILFLICVSAYLHISTSAFAQNKEISYTLEDRDRIMRTQTELASLHNEMNIRFDAMQQQIDFKFNSLQQQINDLRNLFYWAFGIIITLIVALFAYIVFDRRTTLYPLLERTEQLALKDRQLEQEIKELQELKKLKEVIKEYAQTDVKLTELLKRAAIY